MTQSLPLWKRILRTNFTKMEPLLAFIGVDVTPYDPSFILNLPRRLAEKIEKGNSKDPLFLQFVPTLEEKQKTKGFLLEPVEDGAFRCSDRLLQKYKERALLVTTSACAMHCRYCFRQNFDYQAGEKIFADELEKIQNDPDLREVILSGGDPLSLDDRILKKLLERLDAMDHIKAIRFHTRFPIGIPERIDEDFLDLLGSIKTQVWFVVHINHPKELDEQVIDALKRVQKLGIPVLNQAVLLKGVNDTLETQVEMCKKLTESGIVPYYLHQLDRVQGAAHFEVAVEKGKELILAMTLALPGYAVPRYVQEIPFEGSKTRIL